MTNVGSEILCGGDDVLHEATASGGGLRTQAGEDGGGAAPLIRNSTVALRSVLILVDLGRLAGSHLHIYI